MDSLVSVVSIYRVLSLNSVKVFEPINSPFPIFRRLPVTCSFFVVFPLSFTFCPGRSHNRDMHVYVRRGMLDIRVRIVRVHLLKHIYMFVGITCFRKTSLQLGKALRKRIWLGPLKNVRTNRRVKSGRMVIKAIKWISSLSFAYFPLTIVCT